MLIMKNIFTMGLKTKSIINGTEPQHNVEPIEMRILFKHLFLKMK